jgi:hypothetical protein
VSGKPVVTIVPALPGFSLAYFDDCDATPSFLYVPVVAWRIESYSDEDGNASESYSYPIETDNTVHGGNFLVVRYPDGRFCFQNDCWRDNEKEALARAVDISARKVALAAR